MSGAELPPEELKELVNKSAKTKITMASTAAMANIAFWYLRKIRNGLAMKASWSQFVRWEHLTARPDEQ